MREGPSTDTKLADAARQDSIPCTRHYRACAASAHDVREDLHHTLASWGLDDLVDVAGLLATELFANALRHGCPLPGGKVGVSARVRHDGDKEHLRVEVSDAAAHTAKAVRVREAGRDDEGGRGLSMVELLAEGWGVVASTSRKGVWFELPAA